MVFLEDALLLVFRYGYLSWITHHGVGERRLVYRIAFHTHRWSVPCKRGVQSFRRQLDVGGSCRHVETSEYLSQDGGSVARFVAHMYV